MVRAFNPWPVAFTEYHGKPMKIIMSSVNKGSMDINNPETLEFGKVVNESIKGIEVATGKGTLVIHRLQLPGKKAMDVADFLNGHSLSSTLLGLR